ncbi:MAG: tryptophan 2,3-dioxygenase, partial [Caulobacteraceae bacterium]
MQEDKAGGSSPGHASTVRQESLTYGGYLALDELLAAQRPRSGEHDEILFIIIHQSSELWLKLCLHELSAACAHIEADDLGPAFKMIARVARIQTQMIQSWDVLATMTPSDYRRLRPALGESSGFQSWQYRLLECVMGRRDSSVLAGHDAQATAAISEALAKPSLYDESIALLARRGFAIPRSLLSRDFRQPYVPSEAVADAW